MCKNYSVATWNFSLKVNTTYTDNEIIEKVVLEVISCFYDYKTNLGLFATLYL